MLFSLFVPVMEILLHTIEDHLIRRFLFILIFKRDSETPFLYKLGFPCATVSVLAQQSAFVAIFCTMHRSFKFYLAEIHIFCVVVEPFARVIEKRHTKLCCVSLPHTSLRIFRMNTLRGANEMVAHIPQQILRNALNQYTVSALNIPN